MVYKFFILEVLTIFQFSAIFGLLSLRKSDSPPPLLTRVICKIIKIHEKSQKIIFTENVLPYIIWCLSTIPLVWRYFGRVCALTKHQKAFLAIFCSFWSIYSPNKQKIAQNSTLWSTKTLFCVIYKTCSLWYVKITFWAQNRKEHIHIDLELSGFVKIIIYHG